MGNGAVTYYYIHPESGCAFATTDPPEIVMSDPCVIEVDYAEYVAFCKALGCTYDRKEVVTEWLTAP